MQIDHLLLAVPQAKLEAEVTFLKEAFAHAGFKEFARPHPSVVGMGPADGAPFLWVASIDHERKEIVGDGRPVHLAFTAKTREEVDTFHKNALEAGGTDNGKPGVREMYDPNYYAAFVLDPCGNNVELVIRQPPQ